MLLNKLLEDIEVLENEETGNPDISLVCADSRKAVPGCMFVCLEGGADDGHLHIREAAEAGAVLAVVSKKPDGFSGLPLIYTSSTREAFARLCNNICGRPTEKMKFFAVTGTNGKTSVAHLLRAVLTDAGYKSALIGTIGGNMTTPDPDLLYPLLEKLAGEDYDCVVMEASSHALALKKLSPIHFEAGIFTNLTKDHGDFHKSVEAYFEAKACLFKNCATGIFNIDDKYGNLLYNRRPCEKNISVSCTEGTDADYIAANVMSDIGGTRYELIAQNKIFRIWTAMPWRFALYNSLETAACASACGVCHRFIQSGISSVKCVSGRLENINPGGYFPGYPLIYIDYAHTPDALENSLRALRSIMKPSERLTVIFGCGGDRDREKRPVMGKIASELADRVILTEDNSRSENREDILAEIKSGIENTECVTEIPDRKKAIIYALSNSSKGDFLLLAGKGHDNYIIDYSGKHFFSEKKIIEDYYN